MFDFPSIRSVQAVGLMATYHSLAGKKYSRDSAWGLMSLAAKLSQSLGLRELPAFALFLEFICLCVLV